MKQNVGTADRIVRIILGAAALVVAFLALDASQGTAWGIVLAVTGAVIVLTEAVGYCTLYTVFHYSTKK